MFKNHERPTFQTVHSYGTRNSINLVSVFQRLSFTQNSILFTGPQIWNSIPNEIKNANSLNIFKRSFKQFILNSYEPAPQLT